MFLYELPGVEIKSEIYPYVHSPAFGGASLGPMTFELSPEDASRFCEELRLWQERDIQAALIMHPSQYPKVEPV